MFEQEPKLVKKEATPISSEEMVSPGEGTTSEKIVTWEFPDGTIGRGTEKECQEALENWDND